MSPWGGAGSVRPWISLGYQFKKALPGPCSASSSFLSAPCSPASCPQDGVPAPSHSALSTTKEGSNTEAGQGARRSSPSEMGNHGEAEGPQHLALEEQAGPLLREETPLPEPGRRPEHHWPWSSHVWHPACNPLHGGQNPLLRKLHRELGAAGAVMGVCRLQGCWMTQLQVCVRHRASSPWTPPASHSNEPARQAQAEKTAQATWSVGAGGGTGMQAGASRWPGQGVKGGPGRGPRIPPAPIPPQSLVVPGAQLPSCWRGGAGGRYLSPPDTWLSQGTKARVKSEIPKNSGGDSGQSRSPALP